MNFCPNCGARIQPGATRCPNCGMPLQQTQYYSPDPNFRSVQDKENRWLITLLLCIFVGAWGIHRFYTGNTVTGIIMLLTLGGCGIWVLIDLIMIVCNSYVDGDGQHLK